MDSTYWQSLIPIMVETFDPYIREYTRRKGKIMNLFPVPNVGPYLRSSKAFVITYETMSNESGEYRPIGGFLGLSGNEEHMQLSYDVRLYYATIQYENPAEELTRTMAGRYNLSSMSTHKMRRTLANCNRELNRQMWSNGAAELGFLTVDGAGQQTYDSETGTLYFANSATLASAVGSVGGHVDTFTAGPEGLHSFSNVYLRKGMKVDLIDCDTHTPISGATNMEVTYVGVSAFHDTAVVVGVTGPTEEIAAAAAGDYFVKHNTVSSTGISYAPFGLTAMFAPGNPTGYSYGAGPAATATIAKRNIGAISATDFSDWNPIYTKAPSDLDDLEQYALEAIYLVDDFAEEYGGCDTLLTTEKVRQTLFGLWADKIHFNDTSRAIGGYSGVNINVGSTSLDVMVDSECPYGRLYVCNRSAVGWAWAEQLHVAGKADLVASGDVDATVIRLKAMGQLLAWDRKPLCMLYDIHNLA